MLTFANSDRKWWNMRILTILSLFLLVSCGFNGDQKLTTNDSNQNINVNLTFIQQLITLCQQKLLPQDYQTTQLYNQAVANCVFTSVSSIQGSNPLCKADADLSGFTSDQIQQILATCKALGQ